MNIALQEKPLDVTPITTPTTASSDRELSLAAITAWEIYNQEGEAIQTSEAKGWIGSFVGTVDYLFREGKKTHLHDIAEKWVLERDLVYRAKGLILRGEAPNLKAALTHLQKHGSPEISQRAAFYLKPEYRSYKGHPLGNLIDFTANPTDNENARLLVQHGFELEYQSKGSTSALAIYRLVHQYSPDPAVRQFAQGNIEAHEGKSSFSRALQKSVFSTSPENLATEVLIFKGAHRVGKFFSGTVETMARKASLSKGISWVLAKTTGFLAEGNALWVGNTAKAMAQQDPAQTLKKEHLAKSYKANFVMLGLTKLLGQAGNALGLSLVKRLGLIEAEQLTLGGQALLHGIGHGSGLGGMIASSQANEALGYKEKAKGGTSEDIAQDLVGYLAFGIANKGLPLKQELPSPANGALKVKPWGMDVLPQANFLRRYHAGFASILGLGLGMEILLKPSLAQATEGKLIESKDIPGALILTAIGLGVGALCLKKAFFGKPQGKAPTTPKINRKQLEEQATQEIIQTQGLEVATAKKIAEKIGQINERALKEEEFKGPQGEQNRLNLNRLMMETVSRLNRENLDPKQQVEALEILFSDGWRDLKATTFEIFVEAGYGVKNTLELLKRGDWNWFASKNRQEIKNLRTLNGRVNLRALFQDSPIRFRHAMDIYQMNAPLAEKIFWMAERVIENPEASPEGLLAAATLIYKIRPGKEGQYWLQSLARHPNFAHYPELLDQLKDQPSASQEIFKMLKLRMSQNWLQDDPHREAILDFLIGACNHPDVNVRINFVHRFGKSLMDKNVPEEIWNLLYQGIITRLDDPAPDIRILSEDILQKVLDKDAGKPLGTERDVPHLTPKMREDLAKRLIWFSTEDED